MRKDIHETNRLSWNAATRAHNSHKGDQARFLREGGSTLFPEEVELLGDLAGKTLAHLQCNAGQDALSLAKLGAIVTGIDISDTAIDFARQLSADSGIPGTFVRSDIYDWFADAAARGEQFDRVFSSYGTIMWLSDLAEHSRNLAADPRASLLVTDDRPGDPLAHARAPLPIDHGAAGRPRRLRGVRARRPGAVGVRGGRDGLHQPPRERRVRLGPGRRGHRIA